MDATEIDLLRRESIVLNEVICRGKPPVEIIDNINAKIEYQKIALRHEKSQLLKNQFNYYFQIVDLILQFSWLKEFYFEQMDHT